MSKKNIKKIKGDEKGQTRLPMFYWNKIKRDQESSNKVEISKEKVEKKQERVMSRQKKQEREKMEVEVEAKNQESKSNTERFSSISARSSSPVVVVQKKEAPKRVNILFYLNKMQSQPFGQYIDIIHQQWYNDYQKLQRSHSYIQWIFPNSYQSRFNYQAQPLSTEQAEEFRTNPDIIKRYLKSYDMMLAFYGMKLKDRHTGEIVRSRFPNYKERFFKTLLTSFHNHMRITRILTSLKETGFGKFAAELCKFLKFQIYHANGEMNSLKKYNAYKDWEPYERFVEESEPTSVYFEKLNRHRQIPVKHTLVAQKNPKKREHSSRSKSLSKSPSMKSRKQQKQ